MFRHFIIIAVRSLNKRKFYALLNVIGLASGFSFTILLLLYIRDQRSYDQHYKNADRIYRVNADFNMNGKRDVYSNAPRPIGPTLKTDYPEVEEFCRLRGLGGLHTHTALLQFGTTHVTSREIFFADSSVFRIFEREFIIGDPDKALVEPNSIVLVESLAKKIFGGADALGKMLLANNRQLNVTGIIKDNEANTHLPIEAFVSWITEPFPGEMTQWYGAHTYTYILLNNAASLPGLETKIPTFVNKHMKETFEEMNGKATLQFQPLQKIHLSEELVWEPYAHGSETNIQALEVVSILLVLFAGINFINLASARSMERAMEVGVRKVFGSARQMLAIQFLTESILLAAVAGVIALLVVLCVLHYFNQLVDLQVSPSDLFSVWTIGTLLILAGSVGTFAGAVPAFYISSLPPLGVLRHGFAAGNKGEAMRKLLVTTQYFIAIILIAGMIVVAQQTAFIKQKDTGFDKDNVVVITLPFDTAVTKHLQPLVDILETNADVSGVTRSRYSLNEEANQFTATFLNEAGTTTQGGADLITVDHHFVKTLDLKIISGRNFLDGSTVEADRSILINETAAKAFGLKKNPLAGKYVTEDDGKTIKMDVVGVVKDFNIGVSYKKVNPLVIFLQPNGGSKLYIRAAQRKLKDVLPVVQMQWKAHFPDHEIDLNLLDESLAAQYRKEENFQELLVPFSFIAIFISSLGIVGLIAYTTEIKRKEIAIRKVHGATTGAICLLLSRVFLILLVTATIAAIPAGYLLINSWLAKFAYRVEITLWPFLAGFAICLVFTTLSVSYHIFSATRENPRAALNGA